MRRLYYLLSVAVLLSATACSTVKISERGMEGNAMFGTTAIKPSQQKKHNDFKTVEVVKLQNIKEDNPFLFPVYAKEVLQSEKTSTHAITEHKNSAKCVKYSSKQLLTKSFSKNQPNKISNNNQTNNNGKDNPDAGSLRWFFYLILCFAIPPIAYYLVKRETDNLFWICFLCFLLTLSMFGGFRYGILGLISIFIALLALLEIDL